jgi:molybdate-binding protein
MEACNYVPNTLVAFDRRSVAMIGFSNWEIGIVVARGNPKSITGVADLPTRGALSSTASRRGGALPARK